MAKRLYYRIGEACKQVDIQPYVLRYWETEFPALKPSKSKSGQRVYTDHEIGIIRRIKELLYEEGYTIAGARNRLKDRGRNDEPARAAARVEKPEMPPESDAAPQGAAAGQLLRDMKRQLEEIRKRLD